MLIISLHIRNLLLQLLYLLLLENSLVLDWHYLDEILYVVVPVIEHGTGKLTAGIEIMLTDQLVQLLAIGAVLHEVDLHHIHVTEVIEVVVLIPYVGNTTTHTSGEVTAGFTENYYSTARHILAAVVTSTLNHGDGTGVTNTKALAYLTIDIQLTACGTIQTGVTGDDVILGREVAADRRKDGNTTS